MVPEVCKARTMSLWDKKWCQLVISQQGWGTNVANLEIPIVTKSITGYSEE